MIRRFFDDYHYGNDTFFCGCQFTADEGRRGGAAAEDLSPKAKWYYLNADPLRVYEYTEEDTTETP
ncbi:MAG: hypothetical protein LUE89_11270 [Clostridiales bacterium]|nr:hypothetical protein [Clostridiales bacterium]